MRTVLRIGLRFFVLALGLGAMAVGAQERFAGEMFGSSAWLVPGVGGAFNTPERADQLVQDQQRLAGDKGARTAARMAAHIRLKAALVAREAL
jgi:hypothetical protein